MGCRGGADGFPTAKDKPTALPSPSGSGQLPCGRPELSDFSSELAAPTNDNADLERIVKIWQLIKRGDRFYLGVPNAQDGVIWNAQRV